MVSVQLGHTGEFCGSVSQSVGRPADSNSLLGDVDLKSMREGLWGLQTNQWGGGGRKGEVFGGIVVT